MMDALLDRLQNNFSSSILKMELLRPRRALLEIDPGILTEMARWLYRENGCRFVIASGMDTGLRLEIIYHFSLDPDGLLINLQVPLSYENARVESLTGLFEAANWIEREIHEILGIEFINHPEMKPLVSDGNWEAGEYPYRKNQANKNRP